MLFVNEIFLKYFYCAEDVPCSAFSKLGHEAELKDAKHKGGDIS